MSTSYRPLSEDKPQQPHKRSFGIIKKINTGDYDHKSERKIKKEDHLDDHQKTFSVSTLRLPIFCRTNKPFMYIKVMNLSEKYRVSINSEFLKNYKLNFKILRDQSLESFLKNLKQSHKHILKYPLSAPIIDAKSKEFTEPKDMARIYLKLPDKNAFHIQKFTIVLENDFAPGKTIIDKYEIQVADKRTTIYMIDRIYKEEINSSITFISEDFPGPNGFNDFLEVYSKLF